MDGGVSQCCRLNDFILDQLVKDDCKITLDKMIKGKMTVDEMTVDRMTMMGYLWAK
jgi:hypothetical protein